MEVDRFGNPERILCAAVYVDTGKAEPRRLSYSYPETGLVFAAWRHSDCFVTMKAWLECLDHEQHLLLEVIHPTQTRGSRQGFLTSTGRYVDRRDGYLIAVAAGQVEEGEGRILMSEDLY